MNDTQKRHDEQIAYWNGPGGAQWVAQQARTDVTLSPITAVLLSAAAPRSGERVLDIGCGAGATTLVLSEAVGAAGHVTGLDVSAPMLDLARNRAEGYGNIDLVLADAAAHPFPPAGYDLLVSRFGVMFFGDPVAAFRNLRRAARPHARLVFACWRAFDENPWMQIPAHAAYQHIPRLPKPGPEDPGPFAFADPARVTRILGESGWTAPTHTPIDVDIDLGAGGGLDRAVEQATNIGTAARALQEAPEEVRPAAVAAIRLALAPHADGESVKLPGAIWLVAASPA